MRKIFVAGEKFGNISGWDRWDSSEFDIWEPIKTKNENRYYNIKVMPTKKLRNVSIK